MNQPLIDKITAERCLRSLHSKKEPHKCPSVEFGGLPLLDVEIRHVNGVVEYTFVFSDRRVPITKVNSARAITTAFVERGVFVNESNDVNWWIYSILKPAYELGTRGT